MLLLASSLDSLNLPEPPLRNDERKLPTPTQFQNGLADPLQLSPPTLKSFANECSLRELSDRRPCTTGSQDFSLMVPLES